MDETIEKDHEARTIDLFVDRIKPEEFGFDRDFANNGLPAYHLARFIPAYITANAKSKHRVYV